MICSGALFFAVDTGRFLFLHRACGKKSRVWGIVGGKLEEQETAFESLQREIQEEIGTVSIVKTIPLESYRAENQNFEFHTYVCVVDSEFIPVLNKEHDGYSWVAYSQWPMPLHWGVKRTLQKKTNRLKIETVIELLKRN
jgi:8-oxo-dGTP pyrophosphatase MutT (NUDIX family)